MAEPSENPLLSSKPSDSGITVSLHPLVLLTASDQITRHRVRGDAGPIVGILLGQQNGRQITAEHAFAAGVDKDESTGKSIFKQPWLQDRVQQFRDVHKAPALDVVGWFTLCGSHLNPEMVPFQKQITSLYNETGVLLAIHPEAFEATQAVNQKLPLTIYESVSETDPAKDEASMQVDGEEALDIKFRPVPYTVDTDEAEMIAIDYVAKGAGSAIAVADAIPLPADTTAIQQPEPEDKKGKKRADALASSESKPEPTANGASPVLDTLTSEEQDQIASLQTRLNSVRMLQTRLGLLSKFLTTLPPSYISDQSIPLTPTSPDPSHLPYIRKIQALLTRLSLLSPTTPTTTTTNPNPSSSHPAPTTTDNPLTAASEAQSNDVALTQLLSILNQDVQALSELGRKVATVESARSARKKNAAQGFGAGMVPGAGILGDYGDEIVGGGGGGGGRGGPGLAFTGSGGRGRGMMQL